MWLAVSQFGDGIWSRTRPEMDLAWFGHNPGLFFFGGSSRGESILSHFDANGEAELLIPGQWGQARTGGSQSGKTGTELGLKVGSRRRGSPPIGNRGTRLGGILSSVFKSGIDLTGGDTGEAG